jgi:hypothetical protein
MAAVEKDFSMEFIRYISYEMNMAAPRNNFIQFLRSIANRF